MSHYRGQNELVFINNQKDAVIPSEDDERVDLEIVILEPKRSGRVASQRKMKSRQERRGDLSSSTTLATIDDKLDDNEADENKSNAGKAADENRQQSDQEPEGKADTSPNVNEGLLKQLEMTYAQKRLVADNDTYVDYMDYF